METFWDWVTVFCFGALVVLMLQRSMEEQPSDNLLYYLPPSIGCAVANFIGNNYSDVGAAAVLAAVILYVHRVLKFPVFGSSGDDHQ